MEQLLHYVWKHKIFPLKELKTTTGLPVEIIDTGLTNTDAGPDFFNAKIKINGTLWVGNVEIHTHASDWYRHGHDRDKAYDSVILHIAEEVDANVCRADGEPIPQMQLSCPDSVCNNFNELQRADRYPVCRDIIKSLPKLTIHSWMSALQTERFRQKAEQVEKRLERCDGNWEDAFFVTLARNFGFGLNGDAFEMWAEMLSLRAVDKYRDNLFQIEAFFFGQAGLLEEEIDDAYYHRLQKEFAYLQHVFDLRVTDASRWRFLRLRPGNVPHVRIAQLAFLYYQERGLLSRVMEAESVKQVKTILRSRVSEYWETHYHFYHISPRRAKSLSDSSLNLIIINTVVTFLYAYGRFKGDERLCERATDFLEELKAENNYIIRMWSEAGLKIDSAADSQALIQLKKEYCDRKKCLHCRIGYEYLKKGHA